MKTGQFVSSCILQLIQRLESATTVSKCLESHSREIWKIQRKQEEDKKDGRLNPASQS